jgi:hypothetical protein
MLCPVAKKGQALWHQPHDSIVCTRAYVYRCVSDPLESGLHGLQSIVMSPGRNDPYPCASGKKHKKCCLPGEAAARRKRQAQPAGRELPPLCTREGIACPALVSPTFSVRPYP